MQVTRQDIADAAAANGLSGAALCVHSSLSSFGRVAGGARAVVDGLLDSGCTVLVPAFVYNFVVAPPPERVLSRNAWGDDDNDGLASTSAKVYTPDRNDIHDSMGAIPAAVVETKGRARGDHPLNSFAAVGPLARELVAGQAPLDVFAPFRKLARVGGYVVMMGVDLRTMTALHLAEQMAGRTPFRRWANDPGRRGSRGGVRRMLAGLRQHRTYTQADRASGDRRQQPLAHLPDSRRAGARVRDDPGAARDHPVLRCRMRPLRRRHRGRPDSAQYAIGANPRVED